ncbi:hypothetical protein CDAR_404981 [Caerostris darwini]|uniref:Uncharacterized protein n=1 Tax=Caerostris darwini TaxID=1538125 RepID=A0AAV4U6R0_9ARAC|nr:hypothetical protein CDAR_404981 [Caerostris darwini]
MRVVQLPMIMSATRTQDKWVALVDRKIAPLTEKEPTTTASVSCSSNDILQRRWYSNPFVIYLCTQSGNGAASLAKLTRRSFCSVIVPQNSSIFQQNSRKIGSRHERVRALFSGDNAEYVKWLTGSINKAGS